MRKIYKFLFFINKLVWKFNHRLYMKNNNILMKKLGMKIEGDPIYISATVSFDGTDYSLIEIGDKTVISSGVRVLTHDFSVSRMLYAVDRLKANEKEKSILSPVKIGRNVFIGARSIVMPGTVIEDNVVVGAGSVVRGRLEKNGIYIGNPAVKIRTIEEQLIKYEQRGLI
ncbi:acyltransferase [Sulfurovum sp. XGS-02]|uniref:acyltransferase n=1 Tax=Sulfurovum sp. XGS-02 TaxID=2925411 RepID=UPI00205DC57D|nr:acyltransferase [Sulfurovum sp. XGS-02]UPT76867.1 acyltransferase [Sulfurovum sp. XGS-02]